MKLVFLRHATRSPQGLGDCSLNATGNAQAKNIVYSLSPQGMFPRPTHISCSPKRRARETVSPLALATHLPIQIDSRLDERHQNEAMPEFLKRLRSVLQEASTRAMVMSQNHSSAGIPETELEPSSTTFEYRRSAEECWLICSHLDWLETALVELASDLSELEMAQSFVTAEYKVFRFEEGIWKSKGGGQIQTR